MSLLRVRLPPHAGCPVPCQAAAPVQLTWYEPSRSGFEFSARLSCPGILGPPLCLAELERDVVGGGAPRLVWGDTGARMGLGWS